MGPAPIPPHERSWRHPSELAPTAADVDLGSTGRGWVVATGTAAALLAVVLVVAMSPPRSSAPTAVSATTIPAATVRLQPADGAATGARVTAPQRAVVAVPAPTAPGPVRMDRTVAAGEALPLAGAPAAVATAAAQRVDEMSVAGAVPDGDDRVVVLTVSHVYDVAWRNLERVAAPDGSLVTNRRGELLATFVDGELRVLVE